MAWAKLAIAVSVVRNTPPEVTARSHAEMLCAKFFERQIHLQTEVKEAKSKFHMMTQEKLGKVLYISYFNFFFNLANLNQKKEESIQTSIVIFLRYLFK